MSKQAQLESVALLVLRVGFGLMMLFGHGISKVTGFGQMAEGFPDPIGLGSRLSLIMAIGAEVGCSLLLIAGLATRIAALPLILTMLVALFVVHAKDPWQAKELAAVYLLGYIVIATAGGGRYSLDEASVRRRARARAKGQ